MTQKHGCTSFQPRHRRPDTPQFARPRFFALAQAAFDDARRAAGQCTAAVIDLDRLDFVNDTYGHHTGTELIRETGAALAAIALPGDVIGRLGGDEFALLRPGGDTSKEELWFQISTAAKHASGSDKPFALSVSVGVAVARRRPDCLARRADGARRRRHV